MCLRFSTAPLSLFCSVLEPIKILFISGLKLNSPCAERLSRGDVCSPWGRGSLGSIHPLSPQTALLKGQEELGRGDECEEALPVSHSQPVREQCSAGCQGFLSRASSPTEVLGRSRAVLLFWLQC